MKLFVNGKEAVAGMKVQTFRGEEAILLDWYEPGTRSGGNGGRVYLKINDTKMEYCAEDGRREMENCYNLLTSQCQGTEFR